MRVLWELESINSKVKTVIEAGSLTAIFAHLTANGYTPVNPAGGLKGEWELRVGGQLFVKARELQTVIVEVRA